MPSRILKEGICTSETIDALSAEGERFFYRLLVQCDDFGRLDARPSVLRSRCFPLKLDKTSDELINQWIAELVAAALIFTYSVADKTYLQVTKWHLHQQLRAARSKYPEPTSIPEALKSIDFKRNQLKSIDSLNPNPNRESESDSESEKSKSGAPSRATSENLPEAARIYVENGGKFKTGELPDGTPRKDRAIAFIVENVADTPDSLRLWGRVVYGYCAIWSPKSYTVMVNEYYLRHRVPGESESKIERHVKESSHANSRRNSAPSSGQDEPETVSDRLGL